MALVVFETSALVYVSVSVHVFVYVCVCDLQQQGYQSVEMCFRSLEDARGLSALGLCEHPIPSDLGQEPF